MIPGLLLLVFALSFSPSVSAEAFPQVTTYEQLVAAIREIRSASRERIKAAVTREKVREAWETGKLIDTYVLQHKERADYGEQVIIKLAKDLESSEAELNYQLQFARAYPTLPPAEELSWSHFRELLSINDDKEREAITKEAVEKGWGRDELREAVRKQKSYSETKPEEPLQATKPSGERAWRVVVAVDGPYKGKLALDLGFSNFYRPKNFKRFEPGTVVRMKKGKFEKAEAGSENDLFSYEAFVRHVIDGDTFYAMIDLGFGITTIQKLRLRGLDAPELESAEGEETKAFLEKEIEKSGGKILIRTVKSDKYDRYLADVFYQVHGKPIYLNHELLKEGLAAGVST